MRCLFRSPAGAAAAAGAASSSSSDSWTARIAFSSTLALMSSERMYLMRWQHLRRRGESAMNSPRSWRQLCIFMRMLPTCQMRCLSLWRSSEESLSVGGMRRSLAISKMWASRGSPGATASLSASRSSSRSDVRPSRRACDSSRIFSHLAHFFVRSGSFFIHVPSSRGTAPFLQRTRSTMCRNTEKNSICTASEPASSDARLKLKRFLTNSAMSRGMA
mmetsp:Transcript_21928/g.72594  ORF Transcript_21928/g.72594 Transcript_21928/m.72594 type:complete len:218 (-) Transcript_21928:2782-3435(-)